jgi:all-trans-8'-apo-beta-carotenal 15,15'-oxygenase
VGNAFERSGASGTEIVLNYVGSKDDTFLAGAAVAIMRGVHAPSGDARMRTVTLNLSTRQANVSSFEDVPVSWRNAAATDTRFHGIQVRDVGSGKATRFDYGENFTVEEHIVVARPGSTRELDGWIMGSAFDTQSQRTCVSVFDAVNVNNGPIARAWLPYWLPLGFHGNFTAA